MRRKVPRWHVSPGRFSESREGSPMIDSRSTRTLAVAAALSSLAAVAPAVAQADPPGQAGQQGAAGLEDPYFPLEGNGGYDVRHYDLSFSYDPETDRLDGVNRIRARATQTLTRFDLDLQQLDVSAVTVNDVPAAFKIGRAHV